MSDKLSISPEQCRAARAMLDWSQNALALEAKVARATIADFERGIHRPLRNNIAAIRSAFEYAGIEFLFNNDGTGIGVQLRQEN